MKGAVVKLVLLLFFIAGMQMADGQNINTPNKTGPLTTQVNTLTGNLFIPRNDIFVPGRAYSFSVTFFYNAFNFDQNFGYGNGWSFGYGIKYTTDTANNKTIIWGDGSEDTYTTSGGGTYQSPLGFFSTLTDYQPNKLLLTEPDGSKYYFDNNVGKRITRMEQPNGNYINFNYTADTLLTSVVNRAGQSITFTYNSNGMLTSAVDAIASPARTTTYTYDASGNLTQVTDPLGGADKYSYLINGPMKTLSDKNNNTVDIIYFPDYSISEIVGCNKRQSYSYDTTNNVTVVTDYVPTGDNQATTYRYQKAAGDLAWLTSLTSNCCGYNMTFQFDANGNKIKETDANGNVTTYTYDSKGNMLTMTDALNQTTTYTYTSDYNNVASITDARGNVTTMTYNSTGNLTQLTEPGGVVYNATYAANGDLLTSTDPQGNTLTYTYDANGNPASVSGPNGYHATLAIDARGNIISYTDSRNNATAFEYDILDRLKKVTDPLNNNVRMNYDAQGNLTEFLDQSSESNKFKYDASNRIVQYTNAIKGNTTVAYDAMDNVTGMKDPAGNGMSYTYDTRNRLSSVKDALGNTGTISYDANGNMTGASSPNGAQLTYVYDKLNRITSLADATGTIATLAYDQNDNLVSYTNGSGATTTVAYDSLNRVKTATDPLGNSSSYTYDKNSNIKTITDRNGFVTTYTYDGLNRIKTATDNNGNVTTLNYDAEGNVISAKDANNNITAYTYDNLNRLKTTTFPDGKFMDLTYDAKGNIITKRLPDGTNINFGYDSLNRVISKTLPDGNTYTYAYNAVGKIIAASNNAGTVTLTYDQLNRVTSETFDGRTVRYNYNIAGRTQTTIYPDSTVITKVYDTRNRLVSIAKGSSNLVTYQYNNANQVVSKTYGNGVNTSLQYDFANRLSSFSTASGTIQNTSLTYDKEENKQTINRQNRPAASESFTYDNGYRITNYKRGIIGGSPVIQNTYSFDALGNRLLANLNGVSTTYAVNNLNQLTASNSSAQNISFTYDNNGNLTWDGRFYKKYDAEGRLLTDSASVSNVLKYQYDAFGRRVLKLYNGVPVKYTYAGISQIEEKDGITGELKSRTIFNSFLSPLVNEKNNNSFYYHQNESNSVEAITNSAGALVERYQYDLYGKQTIYDAADNVIPSSIAGNRFGFTGQEFDSANGNNHFFFRDYDPGTGRFIQRDPTGYADGMGVYQYVHNDPANGIDVLGLKDCVEAKPGEATPVTDNLSKVGNYISILSQLLKKLQVKARQLELTRNLKVNVAKDARFAKISLATNITNLILKVDKLQDNYQSMSEKDVNAELADIEWATVGIANDLGATNAMFGPVGGKVASKAINAVSALDALSQEVTGHSLAYHYAHLDDAQIERANKFLSKDDQAFEQRQKYLDAAFKTQGSDVTKWTAEARAEYDKMKSVLKWRLENTIEKPVPDCPHNNNNGGKRRKPRYRYNPQGDSLEVISSRDPNEIIGPDGQPSKKWVSVKDRLPYTILFENDRSATAPAKFVRVITPVEPKQDPATFQLSSFGFNNQTFSIPAGTASTYQRLDCRDSLGLYVDLTAGYDQVKNQAFWDFQCIDPVTLLPPADPLVGFLLKQDSAHANFGHAFVNFSIKPVTTAVTLDTIGARASIVFDSNDTIPTNIATNTIDAFAPTSHMNVLPGTSTNPVALSWGGADDLHGCGLKYYTLYASVDGINFNIVRSNITRTDTTFTGTPNTTYYFFVLATDSVGNTEMLRPGEVRSTFIGGTPLPITWLYFRGANQNKDNLLEWATATEQNSKEFKIERSLNSSTFTTIGAVAAAGNSSSTTNYHFTDFGIDKLNSPVMYYRLKQFDINGNFKYSNVVRLNYNEKDIVNSLVYPNPTQGLITITVGDKNLVGTDAILVDENGRTLERIKITANSQSINMARYVNGVYFIRLNNKEVLKIVKM